MSSEDIFCLKGKIAIVTGGSRGIGKMIATEYVKRGVKVYICARKVDVLQKTAAELSAIGTCIAIQGEFSTMDGINQFVNEFKTYEQRLDILVNNAGAVWGMPYDTYSEKGWDKVVDLNLKGVFFLTQKLTPLLRLGGVEQKKQNTHASVINIASIDGVEITHILPETYPYSASKAAVIHMSKVLAKRLVRDNIHVNCISPGAFPSSMNRAARDSPEAMGSSIPCGRVGYDEEMAGPAVLFASRAGGYCVGSNLVVGGGLAMTGAPMRYINAKL